jgi:hypothetical protein
VGPSGNRVLPPSSLTATGLPWAGDAVSGCCEYAFP